MAKPSGTVPSGKPRVPRTATLAAFTPKASQSSKPTRPSGVIVVTERSRRGVWVLAGLDAARWASTSSLVAARMR